jgi:hypothetical protein
MKVEFCEWKELIYINLVPETLDEAAKLLRFGMNTLSDKPSISVSFSGKINCSIYIKQRKSRTQRNSINPETK